MLAKYPNLALKQCQLKNHLQMRFVSAKGSVGSCGLGACGVSVDSKQITHKYNNVALINYARSVGIDSRSWRLHCLSLVRNWPHRTKRNRCLGQDIISNFSPSYHTNGPITKRTRHTWSTGFTELINRNTQKNI